MNKRDVKFFTRGVLVAVFVMLLFNTAFAKTMLEQIEVTFGDVQVFLDGKPFNLSDTEGKVIKPFVYEGEIYLPVGAIARNFELQVQYDSENNHVLLGHPIFNPDVAKVKAWLPEIKITRGSRPEDYNYKNEKLLAYDNRGLTHNVFMSGFKSDETKFLLDKKYKKFRSGLVWRGGAETVTHGFKVKVFVDDKLAFESKIMEAGSLPQVIDLDIALKDNISFQILSQEKVNGKYDDKKWKTDTAHYRNRVILFTEPALY